MSSTSTPPNRREGFAEHLTHSQLMLSAFTVVLLLAGWSIFVWFGIGTLFAPPTPPTPHPSPIPVGPPSPAPVKPPIPIVKPHAPKEVPYDEAERDLLAGLQRSDITARLQPLQKRLEETQSLNLVWTRRMQDLRTNADGRRLATREIARTIQFLEQVAESVPLDQVRRYLLDIQAVLQDARLPLPSLHEVDLRLSETNTQLSQALLTLQRNQAAVTQLLAQATTPQAQTLQQALDTLTQQDEQELQHAVTMQIELLKKNQAAEQRAALDRQQQLNAELVDAANTLAGLESQTAQTLRAAQDESQVSTQMREAKRAAAIREMERAYPAVRALLTPFTSTGLRQLDESSRLVPTVDSLPLSYAGLLRSGALEDGPKGLEILFRLAQPVDGFGKTNDRPLGAFPELRSEFDVSKPEIVKTLKQAQAFLRAHGTAMVEAKLLSP